MLVETPTPGSSLTRNTLISFSAMAFGLSVYNAAINVIPQIYAKEFGLSLAAIGTALLVIRLLDAFSDQLVGILSDHTRTRWGSRKPWIVVGSVIMILSTYYLLTPTAEITIAYFLFWRIIFDVGQTMVQVAYTAWGAELSEHYADRSRINGYVGVSTNLGQVFKNVATIGLFWLGITHSSSFTMELFEKVFWICLVVVPLLVGVTVVFTPQGAARSRERPDYLGVIKDIGKNRPFWFYMLGFLIISVGQGMMTLLFTFYDSYLGVGEYYPYMMLMVGVVIAAAIPFWVKVAEKIGKHKAYGIATFCMAATCQTFWLLDPDAHSEQFVAGVGTVILFFIAFFNGCTFVSPAAMLADVVDYGTWKTGAARAGSYFAFHSLIMKVALAVGTSVSFIMLAKFGYDVTKGAVNTNLAQVGILATVIAIPSTLKVIGGIIVWNFPLDKRRHDILRLRLAARTSRANALVEAEAPPP